MHAFAHASAQALPIATPQPTAPSSSQSFNPSPIAITSSIEMPYAAARCSTAVAFEQPALNTSIASHSNNIQAATIDDTPGSAAIAAGSSPSPPGSATIETL